jgi:aryl-alcohol dehydrogenase-like predicted oxidoreductase
VSACGTPSGCGARWWAATQGARQRRDPGLRCITASRLRDEYARSLEPARQLAAETANLEHELSDLVNAAYGLTPAEIALLWSTAPPRMPIPGPRGGRNS